MRVKLVSESTLIYPEPASNSSQSIELKFGDEFEIGSLLKKDGKKWIEVTLLDGRRGYMLGETSIYELYKITLRQDSVNSYENPSVDSIVRHTYKKGDQFYLRTNWKVGDEWVRIIDLSGNEGFIRVDTKVRGGHKEFNTSTNNQLRHFAQVEAIGWRAILNAKNTNRAKMAASIIRVSLPSGEIKTYPYISALSEDILNGVVKKSFNVSVGSSPTEETKQKTAWISLEKLAVNNSKLRSLYRPIWDQTLKYINYGIIAGITLKAIDTSITLFGTDTWLGIVWLIIAASILISTKISWAPIVAIAISLTTGIKVNLFVTLLATGLVGAIFGVPFGMIVGTIVGYFRKGRMRTAPDAVPEGSRPWILGFFIPIVVLAILIPLYIWFNAHLTGWLK